MKKIVFLLLIIVGSFAAKAQTDLVSPAFGNLLDTVTNTATKYVGAKITGSPKVIGLAVTVTKISGTVAGTASLEASNDGTNYFAIASSSNTNTDVATQVWGWEDVDPAYLYYRVKVTGSGTMAVQIKGKLVIRKY